MAGAMLPKQMKLTNILSELLGGQVGKGLEDVGPGASPIQEQIFELTGDLLGRIGDPSSTKQYWEEAWKKPMMETWEKEVIPEIREEFIGQGLTQSSGLNTALAESGRRLTGDLGSTLANVLFQTEQALPGQLGGLLGTVGQTQRGIGQEQWQLGQPWGNPWLNMLGTALGAQAVTPVGMGGSSGWGGGAMAGMGSLLSGLALLMLL